MKSTNPVLRRSAVMLERAAKSNKASIWADASELLSRPASTKLAVNVGRVSRVVGKGGVALVPGKVLGTGVVGRKLTVGAFSFSESAKRKIESAGGAALSLEEFLKKYPDGSGVKIVG